MTDGTACPEESLLSQFLDGELAAAEGKLIAHHLATCPECRARVERMGRAEGIIRTQLPVSRRAFPPPVAPSHCPSPEDMLAYMQSLLATEEEARIERHLQTCDTCLREAREAARVLFFLSSPREASVPAPLSAQVARSWQPAPGKASPQPLPRLVIQLAERGLRLIESYLVPPLLEVQEVPAPLAAYRGGDSPSALSLRLNAGDSEMAVLAIPEEDGVAVTLTLLGPERQPIADRRIFLRQQGRAIFSAHTDHQGKLQVPRLDPGSYEVACDELHTTFQLELRP